MRTQLLVGLLLTGLLASCSTETGMIISTTKSGDFDGDVATLRYYVGSNNIRNSEGFSDRNPAIDLDVLDRDLTSSPYRLLLHPKGANQRMIKVAAITFDQEGTMNGFGQIDDMVAFVDGSVIQWDLVITPVRSSVVVTETDCLQWIDESGALVVIGLGDDQDCDGVPTPEDCNDKDPLISPYMPEICDNGVDDNCNGKADAEDTLDSDDDGFAACGDNGGDCNDNDPAINPQAEEVCDAVDNNCNGDCDEGFDGDQDGVSSCGSKIVRDTSNGSFCQYKGPEDCDNDNNHVFPGNAEECDGIDNNCENGCDDEDIFDADGDGYTSCNDSKGSVVGSCWGVDELWNDCKPDDANIHPGAHELCDGIDNNCDTVVDSQLTPCMTKLDGSGEPACYDGYRTCANGVPTGDCQVADTDRPNLDNSWCSNYESCDEPDPAIIDPFICSIEKSQATGPIVEECLVRMESPGQLCPGRGAFINVNAIGTDPCSFTLVGGMVQQGYRVGFAQAGDVQLPVLTECVAQVLVNLAPTDLWPDEASFTISYVNGNIEKEVQLHLQPTLVDNCEDGNLPGLVCATWGNVMPAPGM